MRLSLGSFLALLISISTISACGSTPVVKVEDHDSDTTNEGGTANESTTSIDVETSGDGDTNGDGDTTDGSGGAPTLSRGCGDGVIKAGEACDDGNDESGDGCSSTCKAEEGFNCVAVGAACEECGNGIQESSEDCDDGNTDADDGCSASCEVEAGFQCEQGFGCFNCGNGELEGPELCDNGLHCQDDQGGVGKACTKNSDCADLGDEKCAPRSGDGCTNTCSGIEVGFSCYEGGTCERCGDGQVDPNEACDDGNRFSADGCQFNCQLVEDGFNCPEDGGDCQSCGNGWLEGTEACDDGNTDEEDGCDATCSDVAPGFLCVVQGRPCYACGNGIQEGSFDAEHETCDDGSQCEDGTRCSTAAECQGIGDGSCAARADDGCDLDCQIETDEPWACPVPGEPCLSCGNGTIETGELIGEECDDGNGIAEDGCSSYCRLEPGAVCSPEVPTGPQGQNCIVCGDQQVEGSEVCDDGNRYDRDGCSALCQVEQILGQPWTCPAGGGKCSFCGNGVSEPGEACDDGNTQLNDGCSATCEVDSGFSCSLEAGRLRSSCDKCGNGRRKLTEQCDDGNLIAGDGCDSACEVESAAYSCPSSGGALCNNCGDGLVNGLEVCDEGHDASPSNDTAGCSADCYAIATSWYCRQAGQACEQCGNGTIEAHETCDDGNTQGGDGCRADCRGTESGWLCATGSNGTTSCTQCGNGILDNDPNDALPNEQCDDGNNVSADGCSSCQVDNNYSCFPAISSNDHSRSLCDRCGNGVVRGGETCDDKNTTAGDGCSASCALEGGAWVCPTSGGVCRNCGNGKLEVGEKCDEGSANSTAGCNACLTVTANWSCIAAGQACVQCGDGVVTAPFEVCDDGPRTPQGGDGCSADCRQIEPGWLCSATGGGACSLCGNGTKNGNAQPPETCDDGNALANDGCNSSCQTEGAPYSCWDDGVACEECGDGTKNAHEACDDGNLGNGDGCNSSCGLETGWTCPLANVACNLCGDGVYQGTEQCDDGKQCENGVTCSADTTCTGIGDGKCLPRDGDGCSDCRVDDGYTCEEGSSCSSIGCGDGFVAGNEECDDGNTTSVDGCSLRCEIENGYACPPAGGRCVADDCGDTIIGDKEQCDDGLHCQDGTPCADAFECADIGDKLCTERSGDGCSTTCILETTCGDGFVGGAEQCDNGGLCANNTTYCESNADCAGIGSGACTRRNADGCSSSCTWETGAVCEGEGQDFDCVTTSDGCGASSAYKANLEQCDDGNSVAGDGCSSCLIDNLYSCEGDVGEKSQCKPVFKWVLLREFKASSIDPQGVHYDPTRRSFVGYKSQDSQNILELCLDGTFLNHPTKLDGTICLPGGSCTTGIVRANWPLDNLRDYPVTYSSLTGATYDPISHNWYFLDATTLKKTNKLPQFGETKGSVTSLSLNGTMANKASGLAIGDDGRLYMTIQETGGGAFVGIRAFARDPSKPIGFDLNTVKNSWTVAGDEVVGGIINLSGLNAVAVFNDLNDGSALDDTYTDLRAFDTRTNNTSFGVSSIAGTLFATTDVYGRSVPVRTFIDTPGTGMEATTDGSGFMMCTQGSGSCYLFAQTCSDNSDCLSGATCERGPGVTVSYCAAPGRARDDYENTSKNKSVDVDVLVNDTRSTGTCRDSTFEVKSVAPSCELGGTASLGTTSDECPHADQLPCVVYIPPSDGTCNIIDTCSYTLDLGTDEANLPLTDTADVRVTVSCNCGNGVLDSGEQCDDPDDPFCSSACKLVAVCGNDSVEGNETCDDGNKLNGDGCGWDCKLEGCGNGQIDVNDSNQAIEECDSEPGCRSDCTLEVCTDGMLDPGEACDDGNLIDNDGCSSNCELGAVCGDGTLDGSEECDDGNTTDTDDCRNDCSVPFCGDDLLSVGEQCDDGNNLSGDECSWHCYIERCGDGMLDDGEFCDDGNSVGGDGCSTTCTIEGCGNNIKEGIEACDGTDVLQGKVCRDDCTVRLCGDGVTDTDLGESCDDANVNSNDGCSSTCLAELFCGDGITSPSINEDCDWSDNNTSNGCTLNCQVVVCGDGIIDEGEQCDDFADADASDGCRSDCTVPYCGDSEIDDFDGEECDDGNLGIGDGCNAFCLIEAVCGNSKLEPGEECDGSASCSSTCTLVGCGNGVKDPAEACDPSASGAPSTCRNDCTLAVCGDGIFDPGEQCDTAGDSAGCSATCKLKTNCGDGLREQTEECDDRNKVSGDGCSEFCRWEYCGNGVKDTAGSVPEQCDDGNNMSGDGCSSTCKNEPVCGDGKKGGSEQCDDGNKQDGDGCSKTCRVESYCGNGHIEAGEACDDGASGSVNCTANCENVVIH